MIKTINIPYLSKNDSNGWTGVVTFTNTTNVDSFVELVRYSDLGDLLEYKIIPVEARNIAIYSLAVQGKCWLQCSFIEGIEPVALIINSNVEVPTVIPYTAGTKLIPESSLPGYLADVDPIIEFHGQATCNRITTNMLMALNWAAFQTYVMFPDRQRPLIIGDGSPFVGQCSGHPIKHDDRLSFDIGYFTHGDINSAEFGNPPVDIWLDDDPNNMVIDEALFDWEKSYTFAKLFAEAAEDGYEKSSFHEKALDVVEANISADDFITFRMLVTPDGGHTYNHHLHNHFQCQ
ncbi:MAG: hypothetical protein GY845_03385 [Planctomycetes bacterium]|nr:hypothetical protein [Planctomycetota bacterium]